MKKKFVALMLAGLMSISVVACGGSDKETTNDTSAKNTTETQEEQTESQEEKSEISNDDVLEENPASENDDVTTEADSENIGEPEAEDPLGFNVVFSTSYRNDKTGNWRLSKIAEDINFEEYALDYYNNYFESDDEIHIIVNFTRNTTTRIISMGGIILDVTTMDYVDGEEHDAALACSGTLLSEYHVDVETGSIEKIQ